VNNEDHRPLDGLPDKAGRPIAGVGGSCNMSAPTFSMSRRRPMTAAWTTLACPLPSDVFARAAEQRQASLTKPAASLGVLERLAVRLAALQATERPRADRAAIVLFAGDHGVTAQGVSAYPSTVTVEMLRNFAHGGAAINVLARELGASLTVIDAGAFGAAELPGVIVDKPRQGTRDFTIERAMTPQELRFALDAGARGVSLAMKPGADVVILGEMGIGNTTSAAAIAAAILRRPAIDLVGAGTGLDAEGVRRKAAVVAQALELHGLGGRDAEVADVLASVGGLEIAALTGAIISAAQAGAPVLVDGFIVSVAALAAVRLNASCRPWLLFSHRSAEQGHRLVLDALDADPILDLGMRLGEGSGAAVALPILRLACALHGQMATFEEALITQQASCPS
jgi:nicotinate-nucleotide--dimethylbenzimidazole phosphoribosyltransferase